MWLDRIQTEGLLEAAVVYGYFPCYSEGNDLVVLHDEGPQTGQERRRFTFPRQRRDRHLCLADFFRSRASLGAASPTSSRSTWSPWAAEVAEATAELFAANAYRDYLELHGLSVQLTEALAEFWHARVRDELGFGSDDDGRLDAILRQGYRGSRYSFGYPACPDLEDRAKLVELLDPARIGVDAVRGAPAAPRAVDRRHGRPPPRGQVLQRDMSEVDIDAGDSLDGDHPAAVLWDMDGTLVDTEPYWIAEERALVELHGGVWTDEHAYQLVGNDLMVSAQYIIDHAPIPLTPVEVVHELLGGVVGRVSEHVPWRPGAWELLEALGEAGVPCALVTMSSALPGRRVRHLAAGRHVHGRHHR